MMDSISVVGVPSGDGENFAIEVDEWEYLRVAAGLEGTLDEMRRRWEFLGVKEGKALLYIEHLIHKLGVYISKRKIKVTVEVVE